MRLLAKNGVGKHFLNLSDICDNYSKKKSYNVPH